MFELPATKIFSVSEITRSIRGLLETGFPFITVTGEVSNLRRPYSGHLYFTLKDETAQLKAILFKQQQRYLASMPAEGAHVTCRGRISVYESRGDYQLIVDYMELIGDGSMQLAFEQLKRRLAAEGLFDAELKKHIPFLPAKISLITSPTGAAVHDFLKVASNRFPAIPIEIMPVRVQGVEAIGDIIEALQLLNERNDTELIILCRGGGSIEDLNAFNDEQLARAIRASTIPVVSAIGHEVDFTIADFAADLRAPTPSAAAEAVIPDQAALKERIAGLRGSMIRGIQSQLHDFSRYINAQKRLLGDPRTLFTNFMLRVDHLQTSLTHAITDSTNRKRQELNQLMARLERQSPAIQVSLQQQRVRELSRQLRMVMRTCLESKSRELTKRLAVMKAVSPQAVLSRGYAIVRIKDSGTVISSGQQTARGELLEVLLNRGSLDCEVVEVKD